MEIDGVKLDEDGNEVDDAILQKFASAGTKTAIAKKKLGHSKFLDVLRGQIPKFDVTQRGMQSINHTIYNIEQTKLALTPIDDKRFVCSDGEHTRVLGHFLNDLEGISFDDDIDEI